jgi:hypothetical protein
MRLCIASLPGLLLSLQTASYTYSGTADQNSPKLSNVNYFTRINPDRAKKRAIHQVEAMGYEATLSNAS